MNHYEGHAEISTKNKLFKNVTKLADHQQEVAFKNLLPLTFCLKLPVTQAGEVDKRCLSSELKPWKTAFKLLQMHTDEIFSGKFDKKTSHTIGTETSATKEFKLKSG